MDIVEQMRSFESDHEPDGWPAIQMKQVSALCDEVERLQSLLEQERQESLTASCRVAALEMELDSATSIIDSANAQPVCEVVQINQDRYLSLACVGAVKPKIGDKLYIQPIPAQQSPAAAVPDFWREEWKENVMALWVLGRKYNSSIPDDVLDFMRDSMLKMLECSKSPRITEQEALAAVEKLDHVLKMNKEVMTNTGVVYIQQCRAILNKLNRVTNETN